MRERGLDGVICGHIHSAALREVDAVTYVNCGDWVDSCTAIVEHHDGRLELVRAWQPVEAAAGVPVAALPTAVPCPPSGIPGTQGAPAPIFSDLPPPRSTPAAV